MKKSETDHLVVLQIGRLLQSTRKHLGLNQSSVAPELGLDQSALSRVESGKQMLTATQWFSFCEMAGISPDCLTFGFIELEKSSVMRLPARYNFDKHTKVRSLAPLLHFAKGALGEKLYEALLESKGLDPDFFVNLNAEINYNFRIDLLEAIIRKTGMSSKEASMLSRSVSQGGEHGAIHGYYDFIANNQIGLVTGMIENAHRYSTDFKLEVVGSDKNQIDIAVAPASHMREFDYRDNAVLGDFVCHYDRGYFENFSAYGNQKPAKVTILENHYKGAPKSVYRLKAAGR